MHVLDLESTCSGEQCIWDGVRGLPVYGYGTITDTGEGFLLFRAIICS